MENYFNQVLNENDINKQRELLIEWLHNYIDKQNWKRCTDSIAQKGGIVLVKMAAYKHYLDGGKN